MKTTFTKFGRLLVVLSFVFSSTALAEPFPAAAGHKVQQPSPTPLVERTGSSEPTATSLAAVRNPVRTLSRLYSRWRSPETQGYSSSRSTARWSLKVMPTTCSTRRRTSRSRLPTRSSRPSGRSSGFRQISTLTGRLIRDEHADRERLRIREGSDVRESTRGCCRQRAE